MFTSCQKKENDAAEKKAEVKQEKIIALAEVKGIPFTMTYTGLWASPSFDVEDTWESIERINQMAEMAPFDLTRVSKETLLLDCSR